MKIEQFIALVTVCVSDYDEAIYFYTQKLNFILVEDKKIDEKKRWVVVMPPGATETGLLLAKASNDIQQSNIGNQTGGRVFLFLYTNNFERDYQNLLKNNIEIIRPTRLENYGKVLVFSDCYGNLWDLIEPIKN